jgi:hypothetical protein
MLKDRIKVYSIDEKKCFAMTDNHLDGFSATNEERQKIQQQGMTDFFELYDDDDELYYSGYANLELMSEEFDQDEFSILDMATYDSGCTYIKIV